MFNVRVPSRSRSTAGIFEAVQRQVVLDVGWKIWASGRARHGLSRDF